MPQTVVTWCLKATCCFCMLHIFQTQELWEIMTAAAGQMTLVIFFLPFPYLFSSLSPSPLIPPPFSLSFFSPVSSVEKIPFSDSLTPPSVQLFVFSVQFSKQLYMDNNESRHVPLNLHSRLKQLSHFECITNQKILHILNVHVCIFYLLLLCCSLWNQAASVSL